MNDNYKKLRKFLKDEQELAHSMAGDALKRFSNPFLSENEKREARDEFAYQLGREASLQMALGQMTYLDEKEKKNEQHKNRELN